MPVFLVIGHTQPPLPGDIHLDDLAGSSGRWDVLCRCVTAGLLLADGVRHDCQVVVFLAGADTYVRVDGSSVRSLNPDERSTGALIKKALAAQTVGEHEEQPHPGVFVGRVGLGALVHRLTAGRRLVLLAPSPQPATDWPVDAVYVLSDHRALATSETTIFAAAGAAARSLGDTVLHADQAITVALDRISNP